MRGYSPTVAPIWVLMASTTVGVGQRGDVAELAPLGDVDEQPPHDLAAAGLRQLGRQHDLARLGDRADLLGDVVAQLLQEGVVGVRWCP
jgi:hypothetical protein